MRERESGRVAETKRPTFRDYTRMLADRPPKFSAEQVNYRKGKEPHDCDECVHFYQSEGARRSVCEIFRPEGDESVKPDWVCDWFSDDGVRFPLLPKGEK